MADELLETNSERFSRTLRERAASIKSVRNDVYTTKLWQFIVNVLLGGGALTLLIFSMILKGSSSLLCTLSGIALVLLVIVYNMFLRSIMPSSFLEYTYIDGEKQYTYLVLSKKRSGFSDGEHNIEVDRGEATSVLKRSCGRYSYDFFANMRTDVRIVKGDMETYKGRCDYDGKTYRCKIVFKNGEPLYGSVGGGRIKYFDINNVKEVFVVPKALKKGVKSLGVDFPKVPGLHIRDDLSDLRKQ